MQLVMYLGNDFIASVCINKQEVSRPGYMGKLKRRLLEENSDVLFEADSEPEFLLTDIPEPVISRKNME